MGQQQLRLVGVGKIFLHPPLRQSGPGVMGAQVRAFGLTSIVKPSWVWIPLLSQAG